MTGRPPTVQVSAPAEPVAFAALTADERREALITRRDSVIVVRTPGPGGDAC